MSRREFTGAIAGTIILFIASLAVAIVATHTYPAIGDGFVTLFRDAILGDINGDTSAMLAVKVFLNNLQACIILFLGGASLGLLTAFVLATNGLVIGAIIEVVREEKGHRVRPRRYLTPRDLRGAGICHCRSARFPSREGALAGPAGDRGCECDCAPARQALCHDCGAPHRCCGDYRGIYYA